MVGVPGKSKGCNTCRKRRIACSLEKPECMKCIKSNRQCGGYQRETIFIVDQATGENSAGLLQKSHIKTYSRNSAASNDIRRTPEAQKNTNSNPCTALTFGKHAPSQVSLRQQFFSQFLSTFVPRVDQAALLLKRREEETTWLVLVPDLPHLTTALDTAIAALSTARIGRLNNDQRLVEESMKLYGQGLRELQHALWSPKLMYKDETLAACMALAMYEVVECPAQSRGGWVNHSNGCARLIQLRGAEAHTSNLGHHLFLSSRIQCIVQGIQQRRSTYLADPEWTRIAWKGISKCSFDQLLDIMALIPAILEDFDQIFEREPANIPSMLDIVDRCWKVDTDLKQYYDDLESATSDPLYWPEFSTMEMLPGESDNTKVFPVVFRFLNLQTALTCMIYWTALIILWKIMEDVYQRIESISKDRTQLDADTFKTRLPPLGNRTDLVSLAKYICQSIEFCIHDDMRSSGAGMTVIPLYIATLTLRGSPESTRVLLWAKAAMKKVEDKGFRIMKYFDNDGGTWDWNHRQIG